MSMSSRRAVGLVIRRELVERTRQKAFIISTGVTLLIVLAIAIIPGLGGDDGPKKYDVGVVGSGPTASSLAEALRRIDLGADVKVTPRTVADRAEGERLVEDGTLDAAVDGDQVIVKEALDGDLEAVVQLANRDVRTQQALAAAGVSGDEATAITDPPPLETAAIDPPDKERDDRRALVTVGIFFVFGQIFGYGFAVASSVVEEKSSRVVELLLAKIRPGELLTGKIVGVGVLGVAQLALYMVVGLAAAAGTGSIDLPPGVASAFVLVLGWFLLGFAIYSALFAMAGAVASRAEELQNTTSPITFLIMAGYFGTFAAIGDPAGLMARIMSWVPFWSPLVMPIRMAAGEVPAWEAVAVIALVVATVAVVVRLAARVYTGGALRTRGRIKLKEALADAAHA
ncbi:MAG: type transport system permease protein [Actinomycetota bacterium]|nr:type transport system permease protein [Actinomycetota bacterium]